MTEVSNEARLISPTEAQAAIETGWTFPFNAEGRRLWGESNLLRTVATEPERIAEAERRGAVKALRYMAQVLGDGLLIESSKQVSSRADAIENGQADV